MNDERRIDRMAGCSRLGKGVLAIGAFILAALCLLGMNRCFYMTDGNGLHVEVLKTAQDLRVALSSYVEEYHRFPIEETHSKAADTSFRSRGTLLPTLIGEETSALNPRTIKFIEFRIAKNRKFGLWQDGEEWVLSDLWGEPYYIVIDTNEDNMIANPNQGAAKSLSQIPARVIIYSSGKDRDPKTWHDNICSWRN